MVDGKYCDTGCDEGHDEVFVYRVAFAEDCQV